MTPPTPAPEPQLKLKKRVLTLTTGEHVATFDAWVTAGDLGKQIVEAFNARKASKEQPPQPPNNPHF